MLPLEELVGPFYDAAGARTVLGVTQADLDALTVARRVLALTTGDGTIVYPIQQFGDDRSLPPHLDEVLAELARGSDDPWTSAMWVTARDDEDYGGLSALDWLRAGNDPTPVIRDAASDAARWRT